MARWLLTHSLYAATATTAPNTISGTPSTCRPQGTRGNGGSSWTTPRPATTRARAVRLQARKVRSLAKVNRGSGSVPSPAGPSGFASAIRASRDLPRNLAKKMLAPAARVALTAGSKRGASARGTPGCHTRHPAFPVAPTREPPARPPQERAGGSRAHIPSGRARKHKAARGFAARSEPRAALSLVSTPPHLLLRPFLRPFLRPPLRPSGQVGDQVVQGLEQRYPEPPAHHLHVAAAPEPIGAAHLQLARAGA